MKLDDLSLGECCACRGTENVNNLVMHPRRGPVPGTGWGCVVCDLPMDGALSVLCDRCLESNAEILEACHGYPSENRRVAFASLDPKQFEHDMRKHAEDAA